MVLYCISFFLLFTFGTMSLRSSHVDKCSSNQLLLTDAQYSFMFIQLNWNHFPSGGHPVYLQLPLTITITLWEYPLMSYYGVLHIHTYTYTYTCIYICMYICICMHICVYTHIYKYIENKDIFIHLQEYNCWVMGYKWA